MKGVFFFKRAIISYLIKSVSDDDTQSILLKTRLRNRINFRENVENVHGVGSIGFAQEGQK